MNGAEYDVIGASPHEDVGSLRCGARYSLGPIGLNPLHIADAVQQLDYFLVLFKGIFASGIKLICIVSFFLPTHVIRSQQYYEFTLGVEDGLLSPEVEQLFADSHGYLWVKYSSRNALSRFNGISWDHLDLDIDGILSPVIIAGEDQFGIWCISKDNNTSKIGLINRDLQIQYFNIPRIHFAYQDRKEFRLIFYTIDGELYTFSSDSMAFYKVHDFREQITENGLTEFEMRIDVYGNPYIIDKINTNINKQRRIFIQHKGNKPYMIPDSSYVLYVDAHFCTYIKREAGVFNVYKVSSSQKERTLINKINHYSIIRMLSFYNSIDSEKKILFSVKDLSDGQMKVIVIDSVGTCSLLGNYPKRIHTHNVTKDAKNRLWFTATSGLICQDTSKYIIFDDDPEMVSSFHSLMESNDGYIWMGGYSFTNQLSLWDGNKIRKKVLDRWSGRILPGAYKDTAGWIYFNVEGEGLLGLNTRKENIIQKKIDNRIDIGFLIYPLRNGKVAIGSSHNRLFIGELKQGTFTIDKLIDKSKGLDLYNILSIAEDQSGRIWMGRTSEGIAVYDPTIDRATTWKRLNPESNLPTAALSLLVDHVNRLWIGGHNGLYRLDNVHLFEVTDKFPAHLLTKIDLPGNDTSLVSVLQPYGNHIMVGTERAIHFINPSLGTALRPFAITLWYGKEISGGGSEQNASLVDSKGYLWVGVQKGLIRFGLSVLDIDLSPCNVTLSSFNYAGAELHTFDEAITIPKGIRSFAFKLSVTGNSPLTNNLYHDIFLINTHGDTLYRRLQTQLLSFEVDYIPPGTYEMKVETYKNNLHSCHFNTTIIIPKLYEERASLYIIAGILVVVVIVLFYTQYIRSERARFQFESQLAENRKRVDQLRVLALSNYFNPHFINNALHWVQSRYRKDPATAQVVGRLADNVNIMFRNTQNGSSVHPISDEVQLVQNYITICRNRFGENFEFKVHTSGVESIDKLDFLIPVLCIQIHVENALEKGIASIPNKGVVKLNLSLDADYLKIIVEDNGVGRFNKFNDLDNDAYRNSSTHTMRELITVLNSYNEDKIEYYYEDNIYDTDDLFTHAHGTRVVIIIPKLYNYDLQIT
jgi:ligand-binding sensor domain-containing protein